MNITINNNDYNLHVVTKTNFASYINILTNTNICDPMFISKTYEQLSYDLLQDDGYIGLLLFNKTNEILYTIAIFDLNCSQIEHKLDEYGSFDKTIELTLLCSNSKERIVGLTRGLMDVILSNVIPKYKPNIKSVVLYVAQGENNKAMDFYKTLGFKEIKSNILEYLYTTKGGKLKKSKRRKSIRQRHRKNRRKSKRSW
jgi:hypothetical protein